MIAKLLRALSRKRASKRLQKITEQRRNSFEVQQFTKRREAALKGIERKKMAGAGS